MAQSRLEEFVKVGEDPICITFKFGFWKPCWTWLQLILPQQCLVVKDFGDESKLRLNCFSGLRFAQCILYDFVYWVWVVPLEHLFMFLIKFKGNRKNCKWLKNPCNQWLMHLVWITQFVWEVKIEMRS